MRFVIRLITTLAAVALVVRAWELGLAWNEARTAHGVDADARTTRSRHVAEPGGAVDHTRSPGVPPPSNDDYADDPVDYVIAGTFPASDPPANW